MQLEMTNSDIIKIEIEKELHNLLKTTDISFQFWIIDI